MKKLYYFLTICFLLFQLNSFAQLPVADFSYTDVCLGNVATFTDLTTNSPTTWDWNFGDGGIASNQNPSHTYSSPGSYTVTLIAYNGNGYDTTYKIISVFPLPSVNAGLDATICEGSSITLTGSGAVTFNWSPATGLSSTTVSNPVAYPTTTTTYTLTGTDANGCTATDIATVTVNPLPNVNAGPDQTICFGTSANLNAIGATSYIWSPSTDLSSPTVSNPTATPTSTTTFTVTGIDANGCEATSSTTINVNTQIFLTDIVTHVTCNGGTDGAISITPSGGIPPYSYFWSPNSATTDVVSGITAGNYTVTVTDAIGCSEQLVSPVTEPSPIFINFITVSDATCFGANDGYININVNGGTIGYSYVWSNAETSLNISNLSAGTYSVTVTDANSCTAIDSAVVNEPLPDGKISGVINYQGSPINSGSVDLIRKNGVNPNDMSIIDTYTLSTGGTYIFSNVEAGLYLIKAYGDTSLYNCTPTYSINESQWDLATEWDITSNCSNDSQIVSIDLIELPSNSGPGIINGRLVESGGGPLLKAPGDPIPDIDITVDQSPGGSIFASTTTDSLGYFTISNLPLGTYNIKADMFGYGNDISQTITFNGTDISFDVTLCSNDTVNMVNMCNMTVTNVKLPKTKDAIKIYPNPNYGYLNIKYFGKETLNIEIIDITGKVVLSDKYLGTEKQLNITNLYAGIYFIRLYNSDTNYTEKLILN